MQEGMTGAARECPRYQVKAFATPESAQQWLKEMVMLDYHFVSMTASSSTNHFSKELEALVWVVIERDEARPPV